MGTETSKYTKSCLCGDGEVEITVTSPDHPWAKSDDAQYSAEIVCPACMLKYAVDDNRLVSRAEFEAWTDAKSKSWKAWTEFDASAAVQSEIKAFAGYLDTLPSLAAIHRLLTANKLEHSSVGTFRKRWRGGDEWARHRLLSHHLPAILKILDHDPKPFSAQLQHLGKLEAAVVTPTTVKEIF